MQNDVKRNISCIHKIIYQYIEQTKTNIIKRERTITMPDILNFLCIKNATGKSYDVTLSSIHADKIMNKQKYGKF